MLKPVIFIAAVVKVETPKRGSKEASLITIESAIQGITAEPETDQGLPAPEAGK